MKCLNFLPLFLRSCLSNFLILSNILCNLGEDVGIASNVSFGSNLGESNRAKVCILAQFDVRRTHLPDFIILSVSLFVDFFVDFFGGTGSELSFFEDFVSLDGFGSTSSSILSFSQYSFTFLS